MIQSAILKKIKVPKLPANFIYGAIIACTILIGLFIAVGKDFFGALNLIVGMLVLALLLRKSESKVSFNKQVKLLSTKKCLECGSIRRHYKTCSKYKPSKLEVKVNG